MTPSEMLVRRKEAVQYFRKKYVQSGPQVADDFGSYCLELWVQGKRLKTWASVLAIDFMRSIGAADKRGIRDAMGEAWRGVMPPDEACDFVCEFDPEILKGAGLSRIGRGVLVLMYKWGMNEKEIGEIFGFTASMANAYKKEAISKLNRKGRE